MQIFPRVPSTAPKLVKMRLPCSGHWDNDSTRTTKNNCIYSNAAYAVSYSNDPIGKNGNIAVDPKLAGLAYGNAHIQQGSLCIDAGDDSFVQADWQDADGDARILGSHVDIGADESNGTLWTVTPAIVRVSPDGNDANDGSDWAHPMKTLQSGINAATKLGAEVWVKAGTYNERINLHSFAYLYGGFKGDETSKEARDWKRNTTIIDGSKAGDVVTASSVGHMLSTIDGFTIRNGTKGIYCSSSIAITNNTITGNTKSGIRFDNCSPIITGNTIADNSASIGAGIYAYDTDYNARSKPVISGNTIIRNLGNVIYCDRASPRIDANVISANVETVIYNSGLSTSINANKIIDNAGLGIYCSAPASISNNLIARNSQGGIVVATGYSSSFPTVATLFNNTVVGNSGRGIEYASGQPIICNNIAAFNTVGIYTSNNTASNAATIKNNSVYANSTNYSGLQNQTGTNGNISVDPLFANRASGDYHLLPDSPCIDKADQANASATDIDGYARPRDGDGDGSAVADIGCYETPANYKNLTSAKSGMDGACIGISRVICTASFPDRFYVQNSDRTCGIGVIGSVSGVDRMVTVEGTMDTRDGEKVIVASNIAEAETAAAPGPFYMNYNALGGGACWQQAAVQDYRPVRHFNESGTPYWLRELFTYGGANNIGLLVKCAGKVTDAGEGFFYLDGAAAFDDGNASVKGVKVNWPYGTDAMPADDSFVEVVGISSCTIRDGIVVRMLRPVSRNAVRVLRTP